MFIIGLTGGVASGKTTATNYFLNKGIEIIDADDIKKSSNKRCRRVSEDN